jgi:hypothetical protein
MVQAYNFLASWQLFPEKCEYAQGERPLSGTLQMRCPDGDRILELETGWVNMQRQAFSSIIKMVPDGRPQTIDDLNFADSIVASFIDGITFETTFLRDGVRTLFVKYEIMPNGYLRVRQEGIDGNGEGYLNTEYYHKQMSVLPYSSSVSGAVIRPTEEGVIRHKSLTAMEEQTNMQLEQIRKQIELLALQAQEIQKRKELSMIIYEAKLSFSPVIGHIYHLYEKKDGSYFLSMVSPQEWGRSASFNRCVASVKLLADHTWMEVI